MQKYTVTVEYNLLVNFEVKAESLESAIDVATLTLPASILKPKNNVEIVDDSSRKCVGVFEN